MIKSVGRFIRQTIQVIRFLLLVLIIAPGCSNDGNSEKMISPEVFSNVEQNIPGWFFSNQLNSNRYIYLHLPDSYDESAGKTYPTIYLLDANWYFDGSHERIPAGGIEKVVTDLVNSGATPDMIIVGIGNLDPDGNQMRGFDFHSPYTSDFLRFILEELIPKVDSQFNSKATTTIPRVLVGHSSGGYFSTYTLFQSDTTGPNLIENFISLSILQEDEYADILSEEVLFYNRIDWNQSLNLRLYLGVGGNEEQRFLSAYDNLLANMTSRNYPNLQIEGAIYPGHDHGSYISLAVRDGLLFLFGK